MILCMKPLSSTVLLSVSGIKPTSIATDDSNGTNTRRGVVIRKKRRMGGGGTKLRTALCVASMTEIRSSCKLQQKGDLASTCSDSPYVQINIYSLSSRPLELQVST